MLLGAVIAWVVVVGATTVVVAGRGLGTYRRARAAQRTIAAQRAALEEKGITALGARTEQLARKSAEMQAALDRLNASLDRLRALLSAFTRARTWVRVALRFLRG